MASSLIYALDFDGVICDSAPESSRTALLSAKRLWPHLQLPTHHKDSFPGYMINAMIKIRPVIETGYENVLLGRLVSETPEERVEQDFVEPVLNGWEEVRERVMGEWDVSKEKLVEAFGGERDIWIDSDMDVWLDTNKLYVPFGTTLFFRASVALGDTKSLTILILNLS